MDEARTIHLQPPETNPMKRNQSNTFSIEKAAVDIAFHQSVITKHQLHQFELMRLDAMRTQNRNAMDTCKAMIDDQWHAMTLSLLERGWLHWDENEHLALTPKSVRILSLLETLIWKN